MDSPIKLSTRFNNEVAINLILSMNFTLYGMILVVLFPSLSINFFFIGMEKVLYFSLFSPIHSNWPSNAFASSLIMKWKSYFDPLWKLQDLSKNVEFQIKNAMCCFHIFSCIIAMISNLSILYIVRGFFKESYSTNVAFIYFFMGFYFFWCQGKYFFFLKSIMLFVHSFKDLQNSSYSLSTIKRMFIFYVVKSPNSR